MANKKDKDGNWEWDAETEEEIEMAAEARRRAAKKIRDDLKKEGETKPEPRRKGIFGNL